MYKTNKIMAHFYLIILCSWIGAQLSMNSEPRSIVYNLNQDITEFATPNIDVDEILYSDFLDQHNGLPYKFGHSFYIGINFFDYATYALLDNGDKIFRLKIFHII